MIMTLNIKTGAIDFFQIEDLDTLGDFCAECFLSSMHQKLQWRNNNKQTNCATQIESITPSKTFKTT